MTGENTVGDRYSFDPENGRGVGLLTRYNPGRPKLSGRASVLATDYSEGSSHRSRSYDLLDLPGQEGASGGWEQAREMLEPGVADLMHQKAPVEDLERFEEESDADKYIVRFYAKPGRVRDETLEYLQQSDFFKLVNPPGAREATGYKKQTHEMLSEAGIPTIPSIDADDAMDRGESYTLSEIGTTGHGYVVKASNSSRGEKQWRAGDWEQLENMYENLKIGERRGDFLVQPFIPHSRGKRWFTYGGVAETGMIRNSREGEYRTNVSDRDKSKRMRALEAAEKNWIEPPEPGEGETVNLAEAAAGELADRFADPSLQRPNIITTVDLMETERTHLEGLPEEYLDAADDYGKGETRHLVTEMESIPGDMVDHIYMWEGPRSRIPAFREALFLEELAGNEIPVERIWNRVRVNYPSRERMLADRIKYDLGQMKKAKSPPPADHGSGP